MGAIGAPACHSQQFIQLIKHLRVIHGRLPLELLQFRVVFASPGYRLAGGQG
jgi:hypothetical protein